LILFGDYYILVKEAQVWCGDTFANPKANRKQAPFLSLNKITVQHGKNLKTTPSNFSGLDLHVISIGGQSYFVR